MSGTEFKALAQHLNIKDESTGEVEAIIATLNVVDRDFEVIKTGAIPNGSKVKMSSYGHDVVGFLAAGALPVGKGAVFIEGDKAIFRGKVFLATERGRDTLEVLKEMGKDQQWSFGFRVLGSEVPDEDWTKKGAQRMLTKLDVFEVSPVVIGAGIGTETVAAKAAPTQPDRAEIEAIVADLKRREAWLECLKHPDGFLAWDIAESVYRWESKGLVQRGPIVHFVTDAKRRGFYDPSRPDEIFISRGMSTEEVLSTSAHEAHHAWAFWDPSEQSAQIGAEYSVQRYMRRFHLTEGRL